MTSADELAEALAGPEPDFDQEPAPVDMEQAERFLRHIGRLDQADAYDQHAADEEIERVREWLAERLEVRENKRRFYRACLEQTMRAQREAGGPKTLKLPSGELRERAQLPEWEFSDESVPWLLENYPRLVETRHQVRKADAKKELRPAYEGPAGQVAEVVDLDGCVVPGASVTYRGPRYQVVPADPRVVTEVER